VARHLVQVDGPQVQAAWVVAQHALEQRAPALPVALPELRQRRLRDDLRDTQRQLLCSISWVDLQLYHQLRLACMHVS
jgi:hypothetical protein